MILDNNVGGKSFHKNGAGVAHPPKSVCRVAAARVDGANRVFEHDRAKTATPCGQHRLQHAVIRGQSADDQAPAAESRQQALQVKRFEGAISRSRLVGSLVDDTGVARQAQIFGKFRAVTARDAVSWPRAALFAEG